MQKWNTPIIVFSILIIAGFSLVMDFYQESIYPLERIMSHLEEITATSDSITIQVHISEIDHHIDEIWDKLPDTKNPVWIYPTESTNFARIQSDVDIIVISLDKISVIPKDSSAYHTGILDINERARYLQENISDAIPYMYGTLSMAFSSSILLVGSLGLVETIIRKQH